ncbi:MAG TPA: 16S rRNA (cytosine(967)-C(5))-methyltransferase RsmB [Blastocatellia bacterium]|nr:16S rRNA (cytosine(967)-C(5))-methyltransferase RsmB [Blastocatellia bacterium]
MKVEKTNVTPSRIAAFDVLSRVATEDAFASNLLASPRYDRLSREDHALAQELSLGVLRWQIQLDFLIERYVRRALDKLDSEVVVALRLGLYQLKFLSRVPPHAAINESVNLVKQSGKKSAAALVNAALRAAQRDEGFDLNRAINTSPGSPLKKLSFETAHPPWLLERWVERFGVEEARAMALANNTAPRAAFRFNTLRASAARTREWLAEHNVAIRDSELAPGAAVIESGFLSPKSEPVREGWIYLQDEASQLVARLAAVQSGGLKSQNTNLRLLDLCAAPGGKTTLLASLLPANAMIVAGDLHLHRLRTMTELSGRLGVENIHPVQLDATSDLPFTQSFNREGDRASDQEGTFDLVLLDAPCSGLGTVQRNPEIKLRMNVGRIEELAGLQTRLIANAARQLRAGGLLTYSVCSTEPEEGEEVVAWLRQNNPEFRDLTRERLLEIGLDPAPLLTPSFGARTFTRRHGSESFFFCVLWKRG